MEAGQYRIEAFAAALEAASPDTIEAILALCAEEVEFRDPFNHTHTKAGFRAVLVHMFKGVKGLKFTVHEIIGADDNWVLKWTFTGQARLIGELAIDGLSEIRLNAAGLVTRHIDYWDTWGPVFSRIPILGALARMLARPLKI